jgi:folylpolyglutamate synthase/dihydropteroate synthase
VGQAIDLAIEHAHARPSGPIIVSGSVYLVGEVRTKLLAKTAHPAQPSPSAERVGQLP